MVARLLHRIQYQVPWRHLVATSLILCALGFGMVSWLIATSAARTDPVVVATGTISPGTRLTAEHLTVIQAPHIRPAALQGVRDPAQLIGQYTRVQLSPDQIVAAPLVQPAPVAHHVYVNDPLPAELLTLTVFELDRMALSHLTSQDRLHILVLVDTSLGTDPDVQVSALDVPGSGPRVVRVLRQLNVLHVTDQTAFLEVTPAQSSYLWSLRALGVTFVGELATQTDAPLGPVRAHQINLVDLDTVPPPGTSEEAVNQQETANE